MAGRIGRLGTDRTRNEGLRIGTVRRPPRGAPKSEFASRNDNDVWLPNLAPSAELMQIDCEDQSRRHRLVLRELPAERHAAVAR